MVLAQNLLMLVSGFALLVLSGDKLVETSVRIAQKWKIPTSVIAVTLIAAGTSAPEIVTSFIAGYRGISDISIGNMVGSNSFNILLVGGLALLLNPRGIVRSSFFSWPILLLASGLFFYVVSDLFINVYEALMLLAGLVAFVVISFLQDRNGGGDIEEDSHVSWNRTLFFFVASFIGLVGGAQLALEAGINLGRMVGLSERVIGITIISAGTGLPELATSVAAALRGHNEVAIANIIGSNIINTLAIPGLTASFFPLAVNEEILSLDVVVMLTATFAIGAVFFLRAPWQRKLIGFGFLTAYLAYLSRLIIN